MSTMKTYDQLLSVINRPHTADELEDAFAAFKKECDAKKNEFDETLKQYKQEENTMHAKFMATFK